MRPPLPSDGRGDFEVNTRTKLDHAPIKNYLSYLLPPPISLIPSTMTFIVEGMRDMGAWSSFVRVYSL